MNIIYKSAGIIIEDRQLLVVRSEGKDVFFAPGGKRDGNETDVEAVIRELNEELTIRVAEHDVTNFGTWEAPATHLSDTTLCMHVFMVHTFEGELAPSNEIEEIKWVNSVSLKEIELGSIFRDYVIPQLKEMDLID